MTSASPQRHGAGVCHAGMLGAATSVFVSASAAVVAAHQQEPKFDILVTAFDILVTSGCLYKLSYVPADCVQAELLRSCAHGSRVQAELHNWVLYAVCPPLLFQRPTQPLLTSSQPPCIKY
eukprot:1140943-Pelagomonas_calceolata.AAC.6